MSDEATVIAPSPTAQAASEGYPAFQKAKDDLRAGKTPNPGKPEEPEVADTKPAETPEQKKDRRDKSAEGRISELTAAEKRERDRAETEKQRADRLQREFDDFKVAQTKPVEKPTEKPQESAKDDDPKPTLKAFIAANPEMEYAEAVDAFNDARDEWKDRQFEKKQKGAETQRTQDQVVAKANAAVDAARTKYPKFDEMCGDLGKQIPPAMTQFFIENIDAEKDQANATDILYHLGENRAEFERIRTLSPTRQVVELGKLQDKLSKPAQKPEPKPALVSRVPPPPKPIKGDGEGEPPTTADAKTLADFRAAKRARTG